MPTDIKRKDFLCKVWFCLDMLWEKFLKFAWESKKHSHQLKAVQFLSYHTITVITTFNTSLLLGHSSSSWRYQPTPKRNYTKGINVYEIVWFALIIKSNRVTMRCDLKVIIQLCSPLFYVCKYLLELRFTNILSNPAINKYALGQLLHC